MRLFTGCRPFTRMFLAVAVSTSGLLLFACASSKTTSVPPAQVSSGQEQEELWVVARSEKKDSPSSGQNATGIGELRAKTGKTFDAAIPIVHTDVRASVTGYVATVDLTQQFKNAGARATEAVYVFALPPNAAVSDFLVTIGSRRIRGVVRDRAEADTIYQQAKARGLTASLLTAEPGGAFRQSIAGIAPGEQIDIRVTYHHVLPYANGWYEFGFPLRAAKPNGTGTSLRVEINAGVRIEDAASPSHRIVRETLAADRIAVSLDAAERMSNANFVLRYRVAGGRARLTEDTMKLVLANRLSASTAVVVVDAKGVGEGNKTIRSQEGQ